MLVPPQICAWCVLRVLGHTCLADYSSAALHCQRDQLARQLAGGLASAAGQIDGESRAHADEQAAKRPRLDGCTPPQQLGDGQPCPVCLGILSQLHGALAARQDVSEQQAPPMQPALSAEHLVTTLRSLGVEMDAFGVSVRSHESMHT